MVVAAGFILLVATALLQWERCAACFCGRQLPFGGCWSSGSGGSPSSLNISDLLNMNRNLSMFIGGIGAGGGCMEAERCHYWCRNASDPIACYRDCMLSSKPRPTTPAPSLPLCSQLKPKPKPQPYIMTHHHYHTHQSQVPFLSSNFLPPSVRRHNVPIYEPDCPFIGPPIFL